MEHWFDRMSRTLAGTQTRRQALRALGLGLFGAALPGLAVGRASASSTSPRMDCDLFCGQFPPGPFRTSCRNACVEAGGDPGALAVVWTQNDPNNCGAVGNVCPAGQICSNGLCLCTPGHSNCGGVCRNTQTDNNNCGTCGHVCPAGQVCSSGVCVVSCQAGQTNCSGSCTNLQNDSANCGTCGHACSAGQICVSGACQYVCPPGQTACSGVCISTGTDVNNCGACGSVCNLPNASFACQSGQCVLLSCNPGYENCTPNASNGCQTNIKTDVNNCGSCGFGCHSGPQSTAACQGGRCSLICDAGYADCDGNPTTGCETAISNDVNNCGACGNVCSQVNASVVCVNGKCQIAACHAGFANCDGNSANGCETNLTNSVSNCGACGNVCIVANGTAACVGGQCAIATCNSGYANCNGITADGCETNITNSVNNCGACGNACTPGPNVASVACVSSQCAITTCKAGYANCDGVYANGCETNTSNDPNNCGACGNKCASNAVCLNGACFSFVIG